MPVSQLILFTEIAVAETGYTTLGLDAGSAPRKSHSAFSKNVLYAPTLYQSLQTICSNSTSEDTSAKFRLVRSGDQAWMQCGSVAASTEGIRQLETYRYTALLEIIRMAAGNTWVPDTLCFQHRDDGRIQGSKLLQDIDIQFGANGLAFTIEPALLGKTILDVPDVPLTEAQFTGAPLEPSQVFTEIVRTQMLAKQPQIEFAAKALGLTKRTFQRRLNENGTTYSKLLEYVRIDTAKAWLIKQERPVSDIAAELGYEHGTHFSRAFRRVCGVTPREYRALMKSK